MFVSYHRVLGTKPGPMQDQYIFLTTEQSLQHEDRSFKFKVLLYLLHNNDPKRLSAIERLLPIR